MKLDPEITKEITAYEKAGVPGFAKPQEAIDRYFEHLKKGVLRSSETFKSLQEAKKEHALTFEKMNDARTAVQGIMSQISQIENQKQTAKTNRQADRFFELEAQENSFWQKLKEAQEDVKTFADQEKVAAATVGSLSSQLDKEYREQKAPLENLMMERMEEVDIIAAHLKFIGHQIGLTPAPFHGVASKFKHLHG